MNAETHITPEDRARLSFSLFLVMINPAETLSTLAVALATGCTEQAIQALIDEGTIPAALNSEASPSECIQIPRYYVAKLLVFMAGEDPQAVVRRSAPFFRQLNPIQWTKARIALEDLTKSLSEDLKNSLLKP